jgi:hypothetical protein
MGDKETLSNLIQDEPSVEEVVPERKSMAEHMAETKLVSV